MIAMKSNPNIRPSFCIQRHHCLREYGKCPIRCSPNDFIKGDKNLSKEWNAGFLKASKVEG